MADNTVNIKITAKDDSAAAFKSANDRVKGLGETAKGILSAGFLQDAAEGAKNFVTSTIKAASDLGESANAVNKIFGQSSKQILQWGEQNAAAFGLSKRAFNEAIVPLGANLKNAGLSMDQVSTSTLALTKRAADMASVFNTSVGDALEAIQAGLRGEADPLERYGVGLSAAAVDAEALAESGKKAASELTNQERTTARVNLIMKQTASTAGDFKDTQDGLANSARVASAQLEDAKAKIGEGFLPVIAKGAQAVGVLADGFGALPGPLRTLTGGAALLAAGFVFLAPKIIAAKEAIGEIRGAMNEADGKTRSFAKGLALVSAALIASNIAGSAFGHSASKGANETSKALEEYAKSGKSASEITKHLDYDLGTLGSGGLAKTGNAIAGFTESISGLGGVFDESLQHAGERINSIDQALAAMVQSGKGQEAKEIFDKLSEAAKKNGISTQDLIAGLPAYTEALAGADAQQKQVAASASGAAAGFDVLGDSLSKVTDPLSAVSSAFDILLGHDEAVLDFNDAQRKLGETLSDNGTSWRKNSEAADENHRALLAAIKDNEALYEANVKSGMAAQDAAAIYDTNTASLEKQLQKAGYTKEQIDGLIGAYRGLPGKIDTEIALHGLTEALNGLADIIRQVYNIPTSRDIWVKTHFLGGQGQSRGGEYRTGGIKGAAMGGPQDGLTEVGEEGREYVRMPTGAMVFSAPTSTQLEAQGRYGAGGGRRRLEFVVSGGAGGWLAQALHAGQRDGTIQIFESAIIPGA